MIKRISFIVLFLLITSCSKEFVHQEIEPKIDIQQAKIIALNYMKETYEESTYLKDTIIVKESTYDIRNWQILFKKAENVRPPCFVLYIDKIHGYVNDITGLQE